MKKYWLIAFIAIDFLCNGCTTHFNNWCHHYNISITNNSNKTIYPIGQIVGNIYTDTSLDYPYDSSGISNYIDSETFLLPGQIDNSFFYTTVAGYCFDFKPGNSQNGIIVWIFDSAAIASTSWDTIKAHRLYLKRFQINYATIDSLNWEINYN